MDNKLILDTLQIQPLSQEEKAARHILGRLYGPIATCVESTRNGRLYNKPLWEKALKDDIFLEKVETKALFLELGHPADREETDMKQACACIPEVPRIVGDDLYAYVDILDTPNGRLLKTLVDYGFVPGISSRGSGDVMENNQVDPETFFLETWDIVQLPAVKKARLNICESLDSNSATLKKALAESYKAAKEEDKDTMKKALENLNININEELTEPFIVPALEDIPWDDEEPLVEAANEETSEEESTEEVAEEEATEDTTEQEETTEEAADEETTEAASEEETFDETDVETPAEQHEPAVVDVNAQEEIELNTVGDAIELLQEYDEDTKVAFENIQVDGKEFAVDRVESFVDEEDNTLVLGVNCRDEEEITSEDADSNIESEIEDEETSVETIEEIDDEKEASAENNGDEEVIESLKDMVRLKEAMEKELSNLRKAKSAGDARELELQEMLAKYKAAYKSANTVARQVPELQSNIKELNEQLAQASKKIQTLTEKATNAQQLKESIENGKAATKLLNEKLRKLTEKSEALEAKLEGQTKQYTEKLQERTDLAKTYKARFIETLTKYVESKANMLGVQPSEITSRLNENYSLADVDAVCDQILDSTVNFSRLPFSGRTKTSARIAESVSRPVKTSCEYGYDIDDDLLELAGLKK